MSARFALDRERLNSALYHCYSEKLHSWATTMANLPSLRSVGIEATGEFSVPIPFKVLCDMRDKLTKNGIPSQLKPIVIDKEYLYEPKKSGALFASTFQQLSVTAIQETFNIELEHLNIKISAELDKLIICTGEEEYHGSFNIEKEQGMFGCMLLQLPLEGTVGGACVTVHYDKETMPLQFDEYSQSHFYLVTMAGKRKATGKQGFTIKAAKKTPCVVMLVNLIWQDALVHPRVEPDRFPQFLEATHHMNKALVGWQHLIQQIKQKHLMSNWAGNGEGSVRWVNTTAVNPTGQCFQSTGTGKLPLLDAFQTQLFCIPLRSDYCLDNFCKPGLVGKDALMEKVLGSITYISSELALIKKTESEVTNWKDDALQQRQHCLPIYKRIPDKAGHLVPLSTTSLNASRDFIGDLRCKITCPGLATTNCAACSSNQPTSSPVCAQYYVAFLIYPKGVYTQDDNAQYFNFYLNDLTMRLPVRKEYADSVKNEMINLIQAVSNFKFKTHDPANCFLPQLYEKLFVLCQRLKSTNEAQTLLNIVFTKAKCVCGASPILLGSFQNGKTLNQTIAQTISSLNGWTSFSETVVKFIKEVDNPETFHGFCDLAVELHSSNCVKGAVQMAEVLVERFMGSSDAQSFNHVLPALMDLVIILEHDDVRAFNCGKTFREALEKMCIVDVASTLEQFFKLNASRLSRYAKSMKELSNLIVRKNFNELTPIQMTKLLKVFMNMNDKGTVSLLWTKVCSDAITSSRGDESCSTLLNLMICATKHDSVRQRLATFLAENSPLAKEALDALVEENVADLSHSDNLDKMSDFLLFLIAAESNETLANEERIVIFCSSVVTAHLHSAYRLSIKLRNAECLKQPPGQKMYRHLIGNLVSQFDKLISLEDAVLSELFENCLAIEDATLIESLVLEIIKTEGKDRILLKPNDVTKVVAKMFEHSVDASKRKLLISLIKFWMRLLYSSLETEMSSITASLIMKSYVTWLPMSRMGHALSEDLTPEFSALLMRLQPDFLLDFVLEVYEVGIKKSEPPFDKADPCLNIFTSSCRKLVYESNFKDGLADIQPDKAVALVELLLWQGDERLISVLTNEFCANASFIDEDSLLRKLITSNQKIMQLASLTSSGRAMIERFKDPKPMRNNWSLPTTPATSDDEEEAMTELDESLSDRKPVRRCEYRSTENSSSDDRPKEDRSSDDARRDDRRNEEKSWSFKRAAVPNKSAQLDAFLRSDRQSELFPVKGPFYSRYKAKLYAEYLVGISPFKLRYEIVSNGTGFSCHMFKIPPESSTRRVVERRHSSERAASRRNSQERVVERRNSPERIVERRSSPERIVERRRSPERIVERRSSPERVFERRSSSDRAAEKRRRSDPEWSRYREKQDCKNQRGWRPPKAIPGPPSKRSRAHSP